MNNIIIQVDRKKQIEFRFKDEANEYLQNIRKSGMYFYKIYLKEYELETIFLKRLSGVCEEIMKSAATIDGLVIDTKLGKDGEMTMIQKIVCKLELEGLIEENKLGDLLIYRLTKKGLSFFNDYKALEWMRERKKIKVKRDGLREKLGIYNLR